MKQIIKVFTIWIFFTYNSGQLNGQGVEIQVMKEGENLLIIQDGTKNQLHHILIDEVNGHFLEGENGNFYIIYEYYASFNKSNVIYSLSVKEKRILVNKVIHFNYNDREGIPYGWIYYCNKSFSFDMINYDSLTAIESQMEYDNFAKEQYSRSVKIRSREDSTFYDSRAEKYANNIDIRIPLFFQDGTHIGTGSFNYNKASWSNLSMNFPVSFLKTNYYFFDKKLSIENVRLMNDIAYFLEQAHSFKEAALILEKVVEKFPDRTVAYINLGDSYWGLQEEEKAKEAYQTYISLMNKSGKEARIPKRVYERVQ